MNTPTQQKAPAVPYAFALGYKNQDFNPYIRSSVNSDMFELGRLWRVMGTPYPRSVTKTRGNAYHVDGVKYRANYASRNGATNFFREDK